MTDEQNDDKPAENDDYRWSWVGLGAAFGIAVGTVLFAITDEAFWIAIGPGFGVAAAVAFAAVRDGD